MGVKQFSFTMDKRTRKRLDAVARKVERSRADVLRRLIYAAYRAVIVEPPGGRQDGNQG